MARSSLGISATSYLSVWQTTDTIEFLNRSDEFGAAGVQAVLNGDPEQIRAETEKRGMYLEAMVGLPSGADASEFEASLKAAKAAGATALRAACLGTRRYETFQTFEAWQKHVAESHRSLEAALLLLDRYKIPLGLENHKDWTADELVAIVRKYSSEYFGVCLDFGNNIALLDSPMEAIEKLAPYTVTTHIKDVAAETYSEGILLSEVVLGKGFLDLPRAVRLIREARPTTRLNLEMITRNPLKIPMLHAEFWSTLPDLRASDLAGVLLFVNEKGRSEPLPRTSHLSAAEFARVERDNIGLCMAAWQGL